jgi:hypothetical protein
MRPCTFLEKKGSLFDINGLFDATKPLINWSGTIHSDAWKWPGFKRTFVLKDRQRIAEKNSQQQQKSNSHSKEIGNAALHSDERE